MMIIMVYRRGKHNNHCHCSDEHTDRILRRVPRHTETEGEPVIKVIPFEFVCLCLVIEGG